MFTSENRMEKDSLLLLWIPILCFVFAVSASGTDICESVNLTSEYYIDSTFSHPCFWYDFEHPSCSIYFEFSWIFIPEHCSIGNTSSIEFKMYTLKDSGSGLGIGVSGSGIGSTGSKGITPGELNQDYCAKDLNLSLPLSINTTSLTVNSSLFGHYQDVLYIREPKPEDIRTLQVGCIYVAELSINSGSDLITEPLVLSTTWSSLGNPPPAMRLVDKRAVYNQSAVVYEVSFTFVLNYIQNFTQVTVFVEKEDRLGRTTSLPLQDRSLRNIQPLPMNLSEQNGKGHLRTFEVTLHYSPLQSGEKYLFTIRLLWSVVMENRAFDSKYWQKDIKFDYTLEGHSPSEVEDLNVTVKANGVNISWFPPRWPNGAVSYDVRAVNGSFPEMSAFVSRENVTEEFVFIEIFESTVLAMEDCEFNIFVRAVNEFNLTSNWTVTNVTWNCPTSREESKPPQKQQISTIEDLKFLPLIIIPVAVAIIPCMYLLKQRRRDKIIDNAKIVATREEHTLADDGFEVYGRSLNVDFNHELGAGTFGSVFIGTYNPKIDDGATGKQRKGLKSGNECQCDTKLDDDCESGSQQNVYCEPNAVRSDDSSDDLSEHEDFDEDIGIIAKPCSKQLVAVKVIRVIGDNEENSGVEAAMEEGEIKRELDILMKLNHSPNVVKLICYTKRLYRTFIAFEFMAYGDLLHNLRASSSYKKKKEQREERRKRPTTLDFDSKARTLTKRPVYKVNTIGPIEESDMMDFARQIAEGMIYIADHGIVHRDLSARNVLVSENKVMKISDFGLSRKDDIYVSKSNTPLPFRWMAPESFLYKTFSTKSDVWSYGILLWEIWTLGQVPYAGMNNKAVVQHVAREGRFPPIPDSCNREAHEMMLLCWKYKPEDRPNFVWLRDVFLK